MRLIIRRVQHYGRLFQDAIHNGGLKYAILRTGYFIKRRLALRRPVTIAAANNPTTSPFSEILDTLAIAPTTQPLLLIVSDTQIRQCVHYRIHQKIRYLARLGIRAMHISPAEVGRMRSFLPLAHTVIVYRTVLDDVWMSSIRDTGARVLFEFDDVVVGKTAVESSGILTQLTEVQAAALLRQADSFLATAQACDALIVSTPYLAQLYRQPEHNLADKPLHILPNFVETDSFAPPGPKEVTFAYTSPSGSIGAELRMLTDFLHGYDGAAGRDWSILVMGNLAAQRHLASAGFRRGTVLSRPFSDFDSYLTAVATAETVLVPLSNSGFNRAKTPIRLMDAAIAGTQVVFSPVGTYGMIRDALNNSALCVEADDWDKAGARLVSVLSNGESTTADFQQAVRRCFGVEVAMQHYRALFIDQLELDKPMNTPLRIARRQDRNTKADTLA